MIKVYSKKYLIWILLLTPLQQMIIKKLLKTNIDPLNNLLNCKK